MHLTEGRNTGFGKILSALEENGSPKPEFETDEGHNYFITRLFIHKAFMKQGQKGAKVGQKGAEVDSKGAKKGTERSLEILNRMRENPFVTQVKLMEEFNLSRKQIQKIIKYLRLNGLVEREGSNRSGKWIVKK